MNTNIFHEHTGAGALLLRGLLVLPIKVVKRSKQCIVVVVVHIEILPLALEGEGEERNNGHAGEMRVQESCTANFAFYLAPFPAVVSKFGICLNKVPLFHFLLPLSSPFSLLLLSLFVLIHFRMVPAPFINHVSHDTRLLWKQGSGRTGGRRITEGGCQRIVWRWWRGCTKPSAD